MAQFLVQNKLTAKEVLEKLDKGEKLSFPKSVIEYLQGYIGQPYGGFPEPFRTQVLQGMPTIEGRPGASLPPVDFDVLRKDILTEFPNAKERDVISAALYPKVTRDFLRFKEKYGEVDKLDTRIFLVGPKVGEDFEIHFTRGKNVGLKVMAMADLITHKGMKEVFIEVNGIMRTVWIHDKKMKKDVLVNVKADKENPQQVGAPMPGEVIDIKVKVGDIVQKGTPIVILSAMKMETVVQSPVDGKVKSIHVRPKTVLEVEDLIITVE